MAEKYKFVRIDEVENSWQYFINSMEELKLELPREQIDELNDLIENFQNEISALGTVELECKVE